MAELPAPVASFDSASVMLRALARALDGGTFQPVGSALLEPLARLLNQLPESVRRQIYSLGGLWPAAGRHLLRRFDPETVAQAACRLYPAPNYPAAFIGASNGAAMHLAAALGAPWLPQTWLLPVYHHPHDPDDARGDLAELSPLGLELVGRCPDLALHHMHDPNQDRLMIRHMSYFRVKRLRLGPAYEDFLRQRLAPGAPVFVLDCRSRWPVTEVAPRYVFQHGGAGGLDPDTASRGTGPEIAAFLEREGAARCAWDPPPADTTAPEAEWGFRSEMADDLAELAGDLHPVVRITYEDPEDLSPFVADLIAWWYERCGRTPGTLLVESFILQAPEAARRLWAVPFWTKFPVAPSLDAAEAYATAHRFSRIGVTLFAHGVRSIGHAGPADWLRALAPAAPEVRLLGVSERAHPADLAVYFRYLRALDALAPPPGPPPPRLQVADLETFVRGRGAAHRVAVDL